MGVFGLSHLLRRDRTDLNGVFGVSFGWLVYCAEVRGFVFMFAGANTD